MQHHELHEHEGHGEDHNHHHSTTKIDPEERFHDNHHDHEKI